MLTVVRRAALALGLLSLAQPAIAAVLSTQLTVQANGFADVTGAEPTPVDPYTLSFRLFFDPAASDQFDNTANISLISASLPVTGGLAFDYDRSLDELTVGGALTGAGGLAEQTDDVFAIIDHPFAPTPTLQQFDYASAATAGIFETSTGSVAPVPEPATAAVLVAGLGLAGLVRRRN